MTTDKIQARLERNKSALNKVLGNDDFESIVLAEKLQSKIDRDERTLYVRGQFRSIVSNPDIYSKA